MPLLFSYGTLRQGDVQRSTFGRELAGESDHLIGFAQSVCRVADPDFVAVSGRAEHNVVTFTGDESSRVPGTVFEVTDAEIAHADAYEPAGYARVLARLASGREAWVYAATPS